MSRIRNWCFTLNNYRELDCAHIRAMKWTYCIFGKEVGDEGTPHLQGYIELKNAKTRRAFKKKFNNNGVHLEGARSNGIVNKIYCSKEKDTFEGGTMKHQGKRTDIIIIREKLDDGTNLRNLIKEVPCFQAFKIAEKWMEYHEKPRRWKPYIVWFHGSAGTGKSRTALLSVPYIDTYEHSFESEKWWPGYDAHKNVIINDFRPTWCGFNRLLNILDRYGCRVETKGGTRQFLAKKIIITSNHCPQRLFKNMPGEATNQLLRRIDKVIDFDMKSEIMSELVKTTQKNCTEVG